MTDLDKMARDLLAAEYDRTATVGHAQMFRSTMPITTSVDKRAVNAIRAALLTAPPGWKLVPAVPTCEMLAAGERGHWQKQSDMLHPTPTEFPEACGGPMGYAYIAMIAAAPEVK